MSSPEVAPNLHRVVTGHDAGGTAIVILDDDAQNARLFEGGTVSRLVWSTDRTPADIRMGTSIEDAGARRLATAPPPNGSRFAVIDFAPYSIGPMHRTETLDYVLVLSGDVEMQLDNTCISLKAGDVLVQRGTNHSWINKTDQWARVAFVLLDANPLGIGRPITGNQSPVE
ncbi:MULTISPECIES: cupin domain-containing protein [unclassified Beijerinckia]|uniref:cupin domain-containing protein n=1 Tax=unclassified Beijerinckia TaxID=2638183 RepID=UPI0008944310|nr:MULTISPECIES: cupin domain-containing protein [unclassified Beijerinckia]MDH7794803.1 quercetin dioxygenase-like cupin family protein [Beijerinckia sp. GAS462]SEB75797.1 Cupin domain-containing protein [Beijerinckia sp. 28-YEA-48]